MSVDAWFTLAVVVVMFVGLALDLVPPAATVLGAMITLLVFGVIDEEQAFAGFSNPAPLTVAALYVLARAADKTAMLAPLVTRMLGSRSDGGPGTLARLTFPVAGISAFINNTPLVQMMIPEITSWAAKRRLYPSRFLIPLSYAAILGGTITVIGTSTNLVVSGLLQQSGEPPFSLFEISVVGGGSALAGMITLILVAPRVLPDRRGAEESLVGNRAREFYVEMVVEEGGRVVGKTVEEAGLRSLEGVHLVEIERHGKAITPVNPNRTLQAGDRLKFAGRADLIVDLQRTPGLRSAEDKHMWAIDDPQHIFFEAVIGAASPLVGKTLAETDFRQRYGAAVIAIHRAGEPVREKLGSVRLRAGDTLLLLSSRDFRTRWRESHDFLVIARLGGAPPSATRKAPLVAVTSLAVITLAAFEVMPILHLALLAAALMIVARVVSVSEARNAIDLDVILLIAAAFGVGAAIESTGLAQSLADAFVDLFGSFGTVGIVLGVVLSTTIMTEVITNNAAAAVIFPIAISVATASGLDPRMMAIAVAVTASSSFLTPLGYQTNTMVYGPGGYRFVDFLRAGIPVNIAVVTTIVALTTLQA